MTRKCEICEKEFNPKPQQVSRGQGRFCSHKCSGVDSQREKHPQWKGGLIKKICRECGGYFNTKPSKIKKGNGIFCSQKCMGIWRSKNMIGDKAYNWKGGCTPVALQIRHSDKYNSWRLQIFERDNFICRKCGKMGGKLSAHHIKSFSSLIKEIKDNFPLLDLFTMAMMYTPFWDMNNGVTLCEKCHKKTDNYCGRIKNGK